MNEARRIRRKQLPQSGAALLIAIFALMLISVVAIALVVSQGTDSALAGNYRTSIGAYYAGVAGLEEARGRLLWKNSTCFVNSPAAPACTNSTFIPMFKPYPPADGPYLPTMALTDVRYIINPVGGETVDPLSGTYQDTEYETEFGFPPASTPLTTSSIWPIAGLNGPSYKWVRINPVTEKGLQIDVNGDGVIDSATPLLYDPAAVHPGAPPTAVPSLVLQPFSTSATANQALEITTLAVLPNGGRRLLQYVVAPLVISTAVSTQPAPSPPPTTTNINFPASLTLLGNSASSYNSASYKINGQTPSCSTTQVVPTLGLTNGAPPPSGYPGSWLDVTTAIRQSWQTPSQLDQVVQDITKNADVVHSGNTTANALLTPLNMSGATPPLTIVVEGNLNMTGWPHIGNGILLVTGTLTFDGSAIWDGIILVIGQGKVDYVSNGAGGGINGAMLIAKTRGFGNNLLGSLGSASFTETGGAGNPTGVALSYDSCAINFAGATTPTAMGYKILSFREIPTN
jgi:hypothetical protein